MPAGTKLAGLVNSNDIQSEGTLKEKNKTNLEKQKQIQLVPCTKMEFRSTPPYLRFTKT